MCECESAKPPVVSISSALRKATARKADRNCEVRTTEKEHPNCATVVPRPSSNRSLDYIDSSVCNAQTYTRARIWYVVVEGQVRHADVSTDAGTDGKDATVFSYYTMFHICLSVHTWGDLCQNAKLHATALIGI